MVTEEKVREALHDVKDPEFDLNVIDMGLIYGIEVEDDEVEILMTLTSRSCPFGSVFDEVITEELMGVDGVEDVEIELTFDPPWTMERMTEEGRQQIGNVPGHGQGF